jgi:plasmid stability protein
MEASIASLTIRKLDDRLKKQLRLRAARHGRSMEEEARQILAAGIRAEPAPASNLADAIAAIVDPIGGLELDLSMRSPMREPPRFQDWPEDPA